DTATTEIYTLSLHDALPIFCLQTEMLETRDRAAPLPGASRRTHDNSFRRKKRGRRTERPCVVGIERAAYPGKLAAGRHCHLFVSLERAVQRRSGGTRREPFALTAT